MSAARPALAIEGLRVVRGRRQVLAVESLTVAEGESVAVLGPNGAGKSSLLLAGALLLPPAEGAVRLFGEAARSRGDHVRLRRGTSTVFQDAALLDMSVRGNLEVALGLHGMPRRDRRAEAERWLTRLGVEHLARTRAHALSGGEAQRVSLARAFAVRPRLVFLDEPFSSLDPETRARLVGDLRALLDAEGTAALIATHDLSEAQLLAGRAAVLLDGRVAQTGPVDDLFAHPADEAVARFLGYSILEVSTLRRLLSPGAELPADGTRAAVPPHAVHLAPAEQPGAALAGVVAVQGALGRARLVVDIGAPLALDVPVAAVRGLRAGDEVRVRLEAGAVVWV